MEDLYTIQQIASMHNLKPVSVYSAMRNRDIPYTFIKGKIHIRLQDYKDYISNLHRHKKCLAKKEITIKEKEYVSIYEARDLLLRSLGYEYPKQRLYYLIRSGKVDHVKLSGTVCFSKQDLLNLVDKEKIKTHLPET